MRDPLTEIARKALSVTQARAAKGGLDLFEELNRVGLIATEPRVQEIQVSALQNMYDRLSAMQPAELLRVTQSWNSNPLTPTDMYDSVLGWIANYIAYMTND
jgi:hypothetical protein